MRNSDSRSHREIEARIGVQHRSFHGGRPYADVRNQISGLNYARNRCAKELRSHRRGGTAYFQNRMTSSKGRSESHGVRQRRGLWQYIGRGNRRRPSPECGEKKLQARSHAPEGEERVRGERLGFLQKRQGNRWRISNGEKKIGG